MEKTKKESGNVNKAEKMNSKKRYSVCLFVGWFVFFGIWPALALTAV